jgi:hypothetical protein
MGSKSLSSIIKNWANANMASFGEGQNIAPDDRPSAFVVLVEESISNGYSREDLENILTMKNILKYCIPENKSKKNQTQEFLYYVLRDYFEVLDLKFPEIETTLDFDKTSDALTAMLKLKPKKKKINPNIVKRKETDFETIEEIPDVKREPIDDKLSISKISEEKKEQINNELAEARLKKQIMELDKISSGQFVLSDEEIAKNFIPDLDPEVQMLLGLNDKGEIA